MSENNYTKLHSDFLNNLNTALKSIKDTGPLIHCITNPISINDCANAVLALGGRPIMAEHPMEVKKITESSCALCLNIANITDARMESIKISALAAYEAHIPFILDVVGINCSDLRFKYVNKLLEDIKPTVIKGNLAEIKKLAHIKASYVGIDSTEKIENENDLQAAVDIVKKLALDINCIIVATGRSDIVSDGFNTAIISNGSELLPRITGTGCMLNVIIGTMLAADISDLYSCRKAFPDTPVNTTMEVSLDNSAKNAVLSLGSNMLKVILGTAILGICGELAETYCHEAGLSCGLGTYHINLINALSTFTSDDIKERVQLRFF